MSEFLSREYEFNFVKSNASEKNKKFSLNLYVRKTQAKKVVFPSLFS